MVSAVATPGRTQTNPPLPPTTAVAPSAGDGYPRGTSRADTPRPFLRLDLNGTIWNPNGPCSCTPFRADVSAGVRLRGAFDFGVGIGLRPGGEAGRRATVGLDGGAFLPGGRLRLALRYRRYFGADWRTANPLTLDRPRYALTQATLQVYPSRKLTAIFFVALGYASSRETSWADFGALRTRRREIHRGPVVGIGWGRRQKP